MKKYRVVKIGNLYYPQQRLLFLWVNMYDGDNRFEVKKPILSEAFKFIDNVIENSKPERRIFEYPPKEQLVSKEEYDFADKLKNDMIKTEKVIKKNKKYLDK